MNRANRDHKLVSGRRLRRPAAKVENKRVKAANLALPDFLLRLVGRRKLRSVLRDKEPRYRHD